MTKLKKKEKQKRASRKFHLSEISGEEGFAEFRAAVKRISSKNEAGKNRISSRAFLWGLPEL